MIGLWVSAGLMVVAVVFVMGFHLGVKAAVEDYERRLERIARVRKYQP